MVSAKTGSRAGRWRRGALALALAAGLAAPLAAQTRDTTQVPHVMASNGAIVMLPEIAGLSCEDKSHILRRLDLSDYRGPEALSPRHPDYPIFVYEDRLAAAYYRECILAASRFGEPASAFAYGFEAK